MKKTHYRYILSIFFLLILAFIICACDSNLKQNDGVSNGTQPTAQDDIKPTTPSVEYISNWSLYYDMIFSRYELKLSVLDSQKNEIKASASVDIRIVNEKSQTVYSATKTITPSDFRTTISLSSDSHLVALIYINKNEISLGNSQKGTLYFTVYENNNFQFDEQAIAINSDLPVKAATLSLPETPLNLSYTSSITGTTYSSCTISNVSYEIDDYGWMNIYISGEKTYDKDGDDANNRCYVQWKIYDSENYVVDSGMCYTSSLKVGEKFKNEKFIFTSVEKGEEYRLELSDYQL